MHVNDINDAFAAEARRCGLGGVFRESSLPGPLDRPFTHHRRQIEAFISGIDRVRSTRVTLPVAFAFADSPVFNAFASGVQGQHFIGVPFGTVLLLYDVFLRLLATRDVFPMIGEPRAERKHRRYDLLPLSAVDLPVSRRDPSE